MAVIKKTDNLEEVKKNSSVEMKKKLVKKQNSKLKKIFAEIPSDRKTICESLIQNVAFMIVELNDLQDQIHEHGMVEEYKNGENQCGTKPSSAAQIYNATLKSYNTSIKLLLGELPEGNSKENTTNALAAMIAGQA